MNIEMFEGIIDSILNESKKETLEKFSKEIDLLKNYKYIDNAGMFNMMFVYQLEKVVREVKGEVSGIYLHYDFYKSNITNLIKRISGSSCCVDKANTIIIDYEQYKLHGTTNDYSKKAFYIPNSGTFAEWMDFVDALEQLYNGLPDKYWKTYIKILKGM